MTLAKYRSVDITMLALLAGIFEFLGNYLSERWSVSFSLSFASLIAIIGIFRWGHYGTIIYVVAGLPMLLIKQEQIIHSILFYVVANGFIGLIPILFRKLNYDKIRDHNLLFNGFIIFLCLSIVLGKGIALIVLGEEQGILAFLGSFLFTIVVNFILLNVLKRIDGLITNMKENIKKSQEEELYERSYHAPK